MTPFASKEAATVKNNSGNGRKIAPTNHTRQLPRLKRIEGQVRGLHQMIENERDCVEIAHQINAVIAALRRVQGDMVRDHLTALAESSIAGKLPAAKARRLANDVGILMARLG
jgi:DNA-binding FrmR family transcriptional regulator